MLSCLTCTDAISLLVLLITREHMVYCSREVLSQVNRGVITWEVTRWRDALEAGRRGRNVLHSGRGYQVVALIAEQASSLNEKRKGMKRLLHLIEQQEIDVVLIESPDRLVRFGFGYLEETFRWKQVRLEVGEPPQVQTPTEELVADLLSIVTVFSARFYGSRAKKIRSCMSNALKECLKAAEADGTNHQNNQTPA